MVYGIIIGLVFSVFLLVSLIIPVKWRVKESAFIKCPVEKLFEELLHVKRWTEWQMDDNDEIAFLYVGPEKGEGAAQYWESNGTPACLRIDRCVPFKSISYQIRLNRGETVLKWRMDFLSDNPDSTHLTWMCEGTAPKHPIERYLTLFYKWKTKQEMKKAIFKLQEVNAAKYDVKQSA
ncbi:hypothetical protein KUV80_12220 [Fictibacillus nanhaiensis]|uniref:hypothetical protein n=1 Tax=Fictibacillus nanhaiensis TaxID=742169 RepID=UPI001C972E1B|nr:hypothetical protein [Fictibacillus nanhaiensis]MBY6037430.1 hypothetical protein [Fictibacillus nanhaiensis]